MVLLFKHGLQERMIFLMIPCILNVNLDHIFINFFIRISVTFYLPKKGMKRINVAFFEFLVLYHPSLELLGHRNCTGSFKLYSQ